MERPILKELDLPRYTRPDLKEACNFLDMQGHNFAVVKTRYNKKGQSTIRHSLLTYNRVKHIITDSSKKSKVTNRNKCIKSQIYNEIITIPLF